jgi:hypothetical protein
MGSKSFASIFASKTQEYIPSRNGRRGGSCKTTSYWRKFRLNCRTHFRDGQVRSVDRGAVEVQKRRRSGELGLRMIRVGVIGFLEVVEREVEGPNSVEQRRGLSELVLWFSVRGEEHGENDEAEGEEEPGGS